MASVRRVPSTVPGLETHPVALLTRRALGLGPPAALLRRRQQRVRRVCGGVPGARGAEKPLAGTVGGVATALEQASGTWGEGLFIYFFRGKCGRVGLVQEEERKSDTQRRFFKDLS